jgi:hypothetical protein
MFEDLNRIIQGRVEESMWTGINSLVSAFEKHKAFGWKEQITNLVMIGDNEDASTLTERAIGILYAQAEALFQQMKIHINLEDLRIEWLADLVDAMLFEPNDQDGEILAALQAADDSVEAFCNAIAIRTSKLPEEWMEYVTHVSDFTIAVMIEVVNRSVEQQTYTQEDVEKCLGMLNKHQTLMPAGTSLGLEALGEGVGVGSSMAVMVEHYKARIGESTVEQVVDQLISLAILANTPTDTVEDEVLFFLEQIYTDLFDMQKANKLLKVRLGGLAKEF